MSSSWFSCWPSSSPLALSYRLNSFKVMVPLRNNHLYWFSPQHLFLSDELWTSYLILQTAAPVALRSVCHFMPPLSSLFLLFLLMHILCWPLHLRFSLTGTSQLNDQTVNQMTGWPWKGDPCPALRSLPLRVVRGEPGWLRHRGKAVQCYQLRHTALSFVLLSVCRHVIDFSLLH